MPDFVICSAKRVKHAQWLVYGNGRHYTEDTAIRGGKTGLKIRLMVSAAHEQEIRSQLLAHGIEIDDEADLVLRERGCFIRHLAVRDSVTNERVFLPVDEIVSIETFGHVVEVFTNDGCYRLSDRLYKIANELDPQDFLRISNSVIIARSAIRRVHPTLSRKFILMLCNGRTVDVTRSYYDSFKDFIGI